MKTVLIMLACSSIMLAQPKAEIIGKVERIENFPSKFISTRSVDVWLPLNYNPKEKYAVLYMHDGQMLFDASTTWNKQSWDADETAQQLQTDGEVQPFIIVGIHNISVERHANYFPEKPFNLLSESFQKELLEGERSPGQKLFAHEIDSDNYLKFIVTELKPYIDEKYSTRKSPEFTAIGGASMGGLISIYALCEYPKVFGKALCLSTHWPGIWSLENNPIPDAFIQYLKANLPRPKSHKIYFDYGDQTLDALYPKLQEKVDAAMTEKGYNAKNWMTVYDKGADHSEKAWAKRFATPLKFAFGK
ncbi:alpha/beta hydrolase [Flavobacterium sp.]|uniref:alpha/beta hydrolase n=1 Tax=Flavobacterium sp. TaxID=239 RepID=UPI003B994A6E